jgi:transposase
MNTNIKSNVSWKKLTERIVSAKSEVVRMGIDQHARNVVVAIKVDASVPMRSVTMEAEQLVVMAHRLKESGVEVSCVYEAGPCGYVLYRQLVGSGVRCRVIAPQALGHGRQRKTDALDAQALVALLDSYERGNEKAFSVVNVPGEQEELERQQSRERETWRRERTSWEHRGRSLMLLHGYHVGGQWWGPRRWEKLKEELPEWMVASLEKMREVIGTLDAFEKQARAKLEQAAPKKLPKAIGALTWEILLREARGWKRFKNRRAVGSYTGLCPGIRQSGMMRHEGCIDRHGNPRIRAMLLEAVWRMARWQPCYKPVRALAEGIIKGSARKKLAVAAARKLAVDIWRLATGQTTPEKLGLLMTERT